MYEYLLYPKVTRPFQSYGTRYLCQFREYPWKAFIDDCTFSSFDYAASFTSFVVRLLAQVAEGRVIDTQTKQVVFACQMLVPDGAESCLLREIPAEYAQLTMSGFDLLSWQKAASR